VYEVWFQAEINLSNQVSNQTTIMHCYNGPKNKSLYVLLINVNSDDVVAGGIIVTAVNLRHLKIKEQQVKSMK